MYTDHTCKEEWNGHRFIRDQARDSALLELGVHPLQHPGLWGLELARYPNMFDK